MFIQIIKKYDFAKNTLTLMLGTIIAQAISIAIFPILTRIYSPEDFGLLSLYVAFISVLGVIATGRYELAIMLPKEEEDAKDLIKLSVLIAFIISAIIAIPLTFWRSEISDYFGNPAMARWLYLIPISIFLMGVNQALVNWNNRRKHFYKTSLSRINQMISQGSAQIYLGYMSKTGGLIIGFFIGIFSSVLYMLIKNSQYKLFLSKTEKKRIINQLIRYKKIPKFGILGAFCDTGAIQMPIFIITKFYSHSITGMFSLTFRMLNIPSNIVSSAISQVLFQKIVEISHKNPRQLFGYITKLFFILFILYLPVILFLMIFGEDLFEWFFGYQWREAGSYAGYLAIAVALRFAVSPLSAVLGIEKNIKIGVAWQTFYLCTTSITLLFFIKFSFKIFLIAYIVHEVVLYLIYMVLILRAAKSI
jgi:O-antigen/teichoic acid export membrane protein